MATVASTGSETVRVNVRLEGEELAAVDRLCARWNVSRAEALRRAALDGSRWADVNSRLAAVESALRAELERRLGELGGRIDHLWATLEERAQPVATPESPAADDVGGAGPPSEREDGDFAPALSDGLEGPAGEDSAMLARRPGLGRPLAPLRQIVDGEHLEIDVRGA